MKHTFRNDTTNSMLLSGSTTGTDTTVSVSGPTRIELANLLMIPPSPVTQPSISNSEIEGEASVLDNQQQHMIGEQQQSSSEAVVVLQARFETCHDLLEAAAAAHAAADSTKYGTNCNMTTQSTTSTTGHTTSAAPLVLSSPITQIQGVVDLNVLSAIAGVSRSDFVADWQQQQQMEQQTTEDDILSSKIDTDDEHDIVDVTHEGTPLLSFVDGGGSTIPIQPLQLSSTTTMNHHTDTVVLSADAFVETLTDVLEAASISSAMYNNNNNKNNSNNKHDISYDQNDESVTEYDTRTNMMIDDESGISPGGAFFVPRPENYGANLSNQHAFLLEIPSSSVLSSSSVGQHHASSTTNNNNAPHFILALPQETWDDVSDASDESFLIGLSHLPTDVCDVQLEAVQYDTTNIRLDVVVKRQVPIIGYVLLILGLLSLSSVGTAMNLQHNVSPILKSFWRYTSTCVVLIPLTIRSIRQSGIPTLSISQWVNFILCSMCYAFMTSAFATALVFTTLANAFVLSNLAPLFIIVGRYVLGLPVLYMEGMGATIGFIGGLICACDQSSSTTTPSTSGVIISHPQAFIGNCLCIMASVAVAVYLLLAKKLRPHVELFMFTFLLMLTSAILVLVYMILSNEPISWSNHMDHGLWGWTNLVPDRLPLELYISIVCNIFGTTGYIAIMKYFEAVVVSTVMLMEPVLGALMGVLAGSDPLPGYQTWIGNGVVAIGIFLVVWSGARSTETIDATKALLQVNNHTNSNSHHDTMSSSQLHPYDTMSNGTGGGVPLLKNHPVVAALHSPHRLQQPPTSRMRQESF